MEPVLPSQVGASALVKRALCDDSATVDAEHDALEFDVHVRALTDFLTADETETPVTVSVEGEWGSGKTSFLRQLQSYIEELAYPSVFFNAWRHDKNESLWATFALECLKALRRHHRLPARLFRDFRLTLSRFDFEAALPDLVTFTWRVVLFSVILIASLFLLARSSGHAVAVLPSSAAAVLPGQSSLLSPGTEEFATRLIGVGGVASSMLLLLLAI